jgi:hypothetical protein
MQLVFSGKTLTEQVIKAGASLLRLLNERRFPVRAALWLYLSEAREWTLVLAVPKARAEGTMKFYKHLQSVLGKGADLLPLSVIMIIDAKDPLVYSAGPAVKVGNIGGHKFSEGTINGRLFEGTYIYPLAAQTGRTGNRR